jgi:hypothetical protein
MEELDTHVGKNDRKLTPKIPHIASMAKTHTIGSLMAIMNPANGLPIHD